MAYKNTRYPMGWGYQAPKAPAQPSYTNNQYPFGWGYQGPNPAAPAPAAPASPPVTFDPMLDPGYAAGYSAVGNANVHAGAEHDYQIHNIGQTTGYDANGNVITSGPDLNPYAVAAVLKRNYDNSVRGTTNNYAAQGQLYAGSLLNAQANNDWQYGLSSDQAKRSAMNSYHGNDLNVQNTSDSGIAQLSQLLGPAFTAFLAGQRGS